LFGPSERFRSTPGRAATVAQIFGGAGLARGVQFVRDVEPQASDAPAPVFDRRHLSKTYHVGEVDVRALRDVTLALPQGEFVVLGCRRENRSL
jgi:hypothetical protein